MAKIENYIPFVIFFETGVKDPSASNEVLFLKALAKGVANDPADLGGATLVGVTIATYQDYCKKKGKPKPTVSDLRRLNYSGWMEILKGMFWDRWQADRIASQKVAEILVDWVWTSGRYGITIPQKALGVTPDGIVGEKTLTVVNKYDEKKLVDLLTRERIAYTDRICRSRPSNRKFRNGWLRRIKAIAAHKHNPITS